MTHAPPGPRPKMNGMVSSSSGSSFTNKKKWRMEPRYTIVLATFLATLTAYVERVGFSIAFTAMADKASLDESVKGTVLSAFYWGYALSQVRSLSAPAGRSAVRTPLTSAVPCLALQIPGGWMAQLYGGRRMLIICYFLWSLVSIFTPTDAKHVSGIVLARVCVGIAQGFLIPAVHTVLSQVCRRSRQHSLRSPQRLARSACPRTRNPRAPALQ